MQNTVLAAIGIVVSRKENFEEFAHSNRRIVGKSDLSVSESIISFFRTGYSLSGIVKSVQPLNNSFTRLYNKRYQRMKVIMIHKLTFCPFRLILEFQKNYVLFIIFNICCLSFLVCVVCLWFSLLFFTHTVK